MKEIKLNIAGIIILVRSKFPHVDFNNKDRVLTVPERFMNFLYYGKKLPQIIIDVEVAKAFPIAKGGRVSFVTLHPEDSDECWRLIKSAKGYIYKCPMQGKKEFMLVNESFNRVKAYLKPNKKLGMVWRIEDIVYDFLQVLLINYFALNNNGVLVHSVGVRDEDGRGFIFPGESGAGKSTTARIWHKEGRAMVLNDDRMIVRKQGKDFYIYGSPWHGDFSDYLTSRSDKAKLDKILFIHHAKDNSAVPVRSVFEGFTYMYPALFPAFWEKGFLEKTTGFIQELMSVVPSFRMGFVNDARVIDFVRKIK